MSQPYGVMGLVGDSDFTVLRRYGTWSIKMNASYSSICGICGKNPSLKPHVILQIYMPFYNP
ncbi:MAG: hypothetical protein A3D31_06720 [Candidatus Fluviicola riflensis]|nr:MAG: hypothetical protein CHH17_08290 [Candidatus Fluviicola riflensis]OGS79650.1 MAG: hypothetical protein A3D31_06720 [Candidatus Fluviicola riflensis]OGS87082.1 MAG: hypothetical protein A2724_06180 [Fluviicola sp. RIFCSPHIGHO2_01_FULL_43_53]